MMNKKGYGGVPKIINFLMAIVVLAGGALPLLSQFGIIGELPTVPLIVIEIITVLAGLVLLFDGFVGSGTNQLMPRKLNFVTALILLIGGVVPLLSTLGVIAGLPDIPLIVLQGLLIIAGLVLLLDALLGARNY